MRVFIVFKEYDHEGATVLGVYDEEIKAQCRLNEERREELAGLYPNSRLMDFNGHELREEVMRLINCPPVWYYREEEVR